ncbi:type III secretion control protein HpaP [Burkholderia pyrrocinia]|uniref:Type III secretion control protein HpaP n=2 Tax=Burkholderiaceae TaxID=119060 RepID=A0A318IAP6_BURPY|nr:type III secretion control protein HpaP [Burkholderia pyrrocinia]SFW89906.1 type III secretion control protein HpaP [Burkholderia sp. NFACC33-1]SFY46360.1 type III secretion control protein HpaP [Burkholderia sp. NFPP32]
MASSDAVESQARANISPAARDARTGIVSPDTRNAPHDGSDAAAAEAFATGRDAQPDPGTVDTLPLERERFRTTMAPFVHQVTQFCSHDAIRLAGNWNARLVLDAHILAGTTLNLSLSRFDLSLCFETRDPATRPFLAAHLDELEQALRASLHALGQSHDVFLSIR